MNVDEVVARVVLGVASVGTGFILWFAKDILRDYRAYKGESSAKLAAHDTRITVVESEIDNIKERI